MAEPVKESSTMTILIVREEGFWESLRSAAITVLASLCMILPGWWVGSDALQWVGVILFGMWLVGMLSQPYRGNLYTLDDAKDKIDALIVERDIHAAAKGDDNG